MVHEKNISLAEQIKQQAAASVQQAAAVAENTMKDHSEDPAQKTEKVTQASASSVSFTQTVTPSESEREETPSKKRVLIGVYVTPDEQAELRQMFCANGFALSKAYRSAMTYLRQDIELGKAYITKNGEILRK